MKATISIATIAMVLMFATLTHANSIGFTYSQIIDDRSLGITGDYKTNLTDRINFEADGTLQVGDIYNGSLQTDFIFDISVIDLKLLIANKLKGYELNTLGREQSIGFAFTAPVQQLNVDVGIGGKNASPFGTPNAYDSLIAEGFNESDLSADLANITPALKGLPFKNGNSLNAFLSTGFEAGIFEVDLKGVVELLGDGDKQHQVIGNFQTGGKINNINITTALELGLMSYQDTLHYETAIVTTAGFDF